MKYMISLAPSGVAFDALENKSILESALNLDIHLEHSCKDGSCGKCKALLLKGKVEQGVNFIGLSEKDTKAGYILTCCAQPCSDIELQATYYPELNGIKSSIQPCKIDSLEFPVNNVAILQLKLPPNSQFRYIAGQYIDLIINGSRRSYSIANAHDASNSIELHIKRVAGGFFSGVIFEKLKTGKVLRLEGPLGTFFLRESDAPIIFLAGGTGFAPVKAMVEILLKKNTQRNIYIYWGMQQSGDFYSTTVSQWQDEYQNIKYIPVVSGSDDDWNGRFGFIHQAVLDDFDDLSSFEVYACGSLAMIESAQKDFVSRGLLSEKFYSDAFVPAT